MPTKFVTNPRRPAAKKSRVPMRRNYARVSAADNYLRDLRPAQVAQMVREGSLAITHADIGNDYHTVTLFEEGAGENRKRVEAKWFVPGEEWYDLSLGLRDGKVDPATADLFLGPSGWDKREREEQTRAAAKRKGIDIDASRHYFNNPRRNPLHLAHPGHFRQGQVVRLRGARKRYVIATDVDPEVFGYHLVALSGGEVGSAPSGIRASDMELDANQDVSFSGAQAKKLQQKYLRASTMHQEHQRSLVSRRNPAVPSDAVFYATTPGGRHQIVVTEADEHKGEKLYDLQEVTSDSITMFGYKTLEDLRRHIPDMLPYIETWNGEVKVDTLGLAKRSNPRRHNPSDLKPGMRVGKYRVEEVRKRDIIVSYDRKKGDGRELYRVEGTTRADLEHAARTLDSVFFSSGGMPEHDYARNPRRKNPPKGFRIAGPAVKTMSEGLRISKADAQRLKEMMDTGAPRILQMADSMMNGHGVERIPGRPGLMYVNMGDTYDTTLVYDYKTNRFVVSSWGDIVERQPRRFAD